jgi:hypothetical protein
LDSDFVFFIFFFQPWFEQLVTSGAKADVFLKTIIVIPTDKVPESGGLSCGLRAQRGPRLGSREPGCVFFFFFFLNFFFIRRVFM